MGSKFNFFGGLLSAVVFDRSQRSTAPGVAWQSPVRCGTALKDGACGNGNLRGLGLQRTAAGLLSLAETSRCGTTSEDGAGDIFGLLARWRRLARGGSNEMMWTIAVICGLLRLQGAGHLFVLLWRQSWRRVRSVEPCGGFGGPRACEWGVLSGGLVVPAHASVASDSVFVMPSGGLFGCNSTAALGPARRWPLRCGGACPFAPLSAAVFSSVVFITCLCAVWGWSGGYAWSLLLSLCVEFLAVLRSQSNRPVRIVVR
jgi:hypothetical protein